MCLFVHPFVFDRGCVCLILLIMLILSQTQTCLCLVFSNRSYPVFKIQVEEIIYLLSSAVKNVIALSEYPIVSPVIQIFPITDKIFQ